MQIHGKTDIGRVRSSNQDAFILGTLDDTAGFAVVCDGMGGAKGGNVASAVAVKMIADRIVSGYRPDMTGNSVRNVLESAFAAANAEVFDAGLADRSLQGMGTTVVAVILIGDMAYICHVGDSRAYYADEAHIEQITKDHSFVQQMVEKGQLTQDEARTHPRKHFITRALGVESQVETDYNEMMVKPDGILLICTDGLTNMVETEQLHKILMEKDTPGIPGLLIQAANDAGGSDNATSVVMKL